MCEGGEQLDKRHETKAKQKEDIKRDKCESEK